ncbi:MAG: metallophosphoesterase family protein [Gallionella sp.]|jgi:3',5'-cyclic AMP phosphodiesterase CpdA
MRTLIHLSDLHFGRVDEALLKPLITLIRQLKPDAVVVSGDLTQRARSTQFKQARHFLDALPSPQIIVPGNHDVPLHNIFHRFARPLDKYRRYISPNLEPFYVDDEIAVIGINSARSLTLKNGRVNQRQIARVQERLSNLDAHLIKVIVTHHPFDLPIDYTKKEIIGRAPMAMKIFASHGADLLLAGHLHVSHAGNTAARYALGGYAALVVQAGTATSTRQRGESNSFNVIQINSPRISIQRFTWIPEQSEFTVLTTESFQRSDHGWERDV